MESLFKDIRYAARTLAKSPGFALVAVIALALGIGANTAMFSFTDSMLVRPLHFNDLDHLVMVWSGQPGAFERDNVSPADFIDWKNQSSAFEHLSAMNWWDVNLTGGGEPERVQGFQVSPNFFDSLQVKPELGRTLLPDEDQPGRDQVAVLSHGLWQRRFGSDRNIIGKTIKLDGREYSAVGVMPSDFSWPNGAELWTPLAMTNEQKRVRHSRYLLVMGRIRPDLAIGAARAEMDLIGRRLEEQYPDTNRGISANLQRLPGQITDDFTRPFLIAMMGAVGFVLLIACANVANLQLARAAGRNKEMAIRVAVGASRWRVLRQLLTESLILSAAGALLGVFLAMWGLDAIKASIPPDLARLITGMQYVSIDARALGFTLAITLATGLISGLAPALQASKPDLTETLKEGGRTSGPGGGRRRLRELLVVSEVSLAFVLLVGVGLMVRGFARSIENQKQGFEPRNVLTMRITLPDSKYKGSHNRLAFHDRLIERVSAVAGVESAGLVSSLPSSGNWNSTSFAIEGRPSEPGERIAADYQAVSAGYFQALRIPLAGGREFGSQDGESSTPVVIVSQNLAARYFPGESPVGRRILTISAAALGENGGPSQRVWRTIVGVAGDVKQFMFDKGPRLTLYVPHAQLPLPSTSLVVRGSGDPMGLVSAVRAQVGGLDPDLPVYRVKSMEDVISEHVSGVRISAGLMSIFGAMALVLAAVGVYSVMACSVSQRTHEIGVRMALGASPKDVLRLVVGQALKMAAVGLAAGLPIALVLTKLMVSAFFGVVSNDAATFAGLTLVLAGAAALSGYVPARRAARLDPMIALRCE